MKVVFYHGISFWWKPILTNTGNEGNFTLFTIFCLFCPTTEYRAMCEGLYSIWCWAKGGTISQAGSFYGVGSNPREPHTKKITKRFDSHCFKKMKVWIHFHPTTFNFLTKMKHIHIQIIDSYIPANFSRTKSISDLFLHFFSLFFFLFFFLGGGSLPWWWLQSVLAGTFTLLPRSVCPPSHLTPQFDAPQHEVRQYCTTIRTDI